MYFKLHNKLYSCTLWKGCALLELAVFFRKKGEAESKFRNQIQNLKVKIQQQEVKKSVDKLKVLIISKTLSNQVCKKVCKKPIIDRRDASSRWTCRSNFCRHIQKILSNREVPFVVFTSLHFESSKINRLPQIYRQIVAKLLEILPQIKNSVK